MNQPTNNENERIVVKRYYGYCTKCKEYIEMDVKRTVCPFCGAIVDLPFDHKAD